MQTIRRDERTASGHPEPDSDPQMQLDEFKQSPWGSVQATIACFLKSIVGIYLESARLASDGSERETYIDHTAPRRRRYW
jgi:hypothetical protein